MDSSPVCLGCHRTFKDARGLSIHRSRCRPDYTTTCKHCNFQCSTIYVLNDHYTTCLAYNLFTKQEEFNKQIKEIETHYETKLKQQAEETQDKYNRLVRQTDSHVDMIVTDQKKMSEQLKLEESKYKEKESLVQRLQAKINQLEKKNDMLNSNMIEFAKKATDQKVTTIYNGNVSTVQQHNLQLQHFDASQFRDKIKPPHRMIYDVTQLVEQMHKFGLGNYYRSLDRSRNVVLWIDENGNEIRDSNCSQIRERILTSVEDDIRIQINYQRKRAEQLEKLEGTEHLDELGDIYSNINFCQKLLDRNIHVMKDLQKELSKRAKNKTDTSVDIPRLVGNTSFMHILSSILFPSLLDWVKLSLHEFGDWLGIRLQDHIKVEGAVLYQEKKFIVIQNDEDISCMIYSGEFALMIKEVFYSYIPIKLVPTINEIAERLLSVEYSRYIQLKEWIDNPQEVDSELVMTHLVNKAFTSHRH